MRHKFLGKLIPVKPEECSSYHTAVVLTVLISMVTLIFSALEVILFKVYNKKVRHSNTFLCYVIEMFLDTSLGSCGARKLKHFSKKSFDKAVKN